MAVIVRCPNPNCRAAYKVASEGVRGTARCKKCAQTFSVETNRRFENDTSQPELDHILLEYMRRRDAGEPIDQKAVIAANPTLATELQKYFAQELAVNRAMLGETVDFSRPLGNQIPLPVIAPYVFIRKLGQGGMGEVYLASDPRLDRKVAIKVLPPEVANDQERVARFLREARMAAKVQHSNTVVIHEADVRNGQAFLVMEFVDGHSLDKVIAAGKPMEWREATKAIRDAAAGLAAAHELNVIHRDVKPANLMRTRNGTTKVVDFGLARALQSDTQLTQEGLLLGTPAFMAPELWMGQEANFSTDLYALICTYFRLLTGRGPYDATSFPVLGYQHRHEQFPDPRDHSPRLPDVVCRILARGGQKDPKDRHESALELLADLDRVMATADVSRRDNWHDGPSMNDAVDDTENRAINTRIIPALTARGARSSRFRRPRIWAATAALALPLLLLALTSLLSTHNQDVRKSAGDLGSLSSNPPTPDVEQPEIDATSELKPSPNSTGAAASPPHATKSTLNLPENASSTSGEVAAKKSPIIPQTETTSLSESTSARQIAANEVHLDTPPENPAAKSSSAEEYAKAQRIFALGGWCQVSEGDTDREARDPSELPSDVNTIVRVFFLSDASRQMVTDAELASLADLKGLRELYVNGAHVTGEELSRLASCRNLWKLALSETELSDHGLAEISKLSSIRDLVCDKTKVTIEGLPYLQTLPLESLSLNDTAVSDAGLAHVAEIPLKSLSVKGTQITDAGMSQLGRIQTLETLSLSHTEISDAGIVQLKNLSGLRTLDAERTYVSNASLRNLPTNLEVLLVNYARVTSQGLRYVGRFSKLKHLGLAGSEIDAGMHYIRRCSLLEKLNLGDSDITDTGLAKLSNHVALIEIAAFRTALTGYGIANLENLEGLNLNATNVGKAGVDEIATLSKLKWLFLDWNKLVDADLASISHLQAVEYLNLANNDLTDAILPELAKLVRLRNGLDLTNNPKMTRAAVDSLRRNLKRCVIHF